MQNNSTTIRLNSNVRDRLARLCGKRRTYNDFLNELMDKYEKGCKEVS